MEKSWRKYDQKLAPDLFLFLVNNSGQPLHARKSFKDILKGDYQKLLKS